MKPLLLHGPAINSSRQKLIILKEKFDTNNVVVFESGASNQDVIGNLMTQPIFAEERLIILENPDENFIDYTLTPTPNTLILWFDHTVDEKKPIFEWVKKNGQILYFPEGKEVSVFPLLDFLAVGDKKAFLEIKKLKDGGLPAGRQGFDIFYIITMVFYLLRNLVVIPQKAPEFVKQKLVKQRKRIQKEDLKNLYRKVLEIDFKIKSGLLEKSQAEFLLIHKFTG